MTFRSQAIADSNPDIAHGDILAGDGSGPEVLEDSEALKNVPAIKDDKIVYFPQDTYLNGHPDLHRSSSTPSPTSSKNRRAPPSLRTRSRV